MGALGGMDPNGGIWGALERGSLEGLVNGTLSAAGGGNFESGFLGARVGSVGSYEVGGISSGQGDHLRGADWERAGIPLLPRARCTTKTPNPAIA
jgi:hypothetical protein